MPKNNRRGWRNKDALEATARKHPKLTASCAAWMEAAHAQGERRRDWLAQGLAKQDEQDPNCTTPAASTCPPGQDEFISADGGSFHDLSGEYIPTAPVANQSSPAIDVLTALQKVCPDYPGGMHQPCSEPGSPGIPTVEQRAEEGLDEWIAKDAWVPGSVQQIINEMRRLDEEQSLATQPRAKSTKLSKAAMKLAGVKAKRATYSDAQRKQCIMLHDQYASKTQGQRAIQAVPGYEKVTYQMVDRWRKPKAKRKRGRKVCDEFEAEVVKERWYTVDGEEIQKWKHHRLVRNLTFSHGWVWYLLKRQCLRRRRITSEVKPKPSVAEIRRRMAEIQRVIRERQLEGGLVWNFDETGVRWAENLKYQYIPEGAQRAENPEGDSSGRFTAMVGANDLGSFFPMFTIVQIKCKTKTDLTTSRTLKMMNAQGGAADPRDGWVLHIWEGSITTTVKGKSVTTCHRRPYLINAKNLDVITVQHKARMDSVACLMWVELQLGPWRRQNSPCQAPLAVVDNCGCHHVVEVVNAFMDNGWLIEFLPPNMTGELQPMDLVVNGPIKQYMRKRRIEKSVMYFQKYKSDVWQAIATKGAIPPFKAPVPKMRDGLAALKELYETLFRSAKMQSSVVKCFQNVGLAMVPQSDKCAAHFKQYVLSGRHGKCTASAPASLSQATDLTFSASLLPIDSRGGNESDEDLDANANGVSDSDDESDDGFASA